MSSPILISSVFSPFIFGWRWWFGGQAAEDSCTDRHWSAVSFPAVTVTTSEKKPSFPFCLGNDENSVDGSTTVSLSLFPAAAPLLNVRQASEPTHWLLGAVLLLLAYLGWKPLGNWANVVSTLSFWIYSLSQDHYYCMNICLPSVHIVYIICMCICLTYVFNFRH